MFPNKIDTFNLTFITHAVKLFQRIMLNKSPIKYSKYIIIDQTIFNFGSHSMVYTSIFFDQNLLPQENSRSHNNQVRHLRQASKYVRI